jgi:putative GTP pyrophosphokinase
MRNQPFLNSIVRVIQESISLQLDSVGLFYRIFSRVKSDDSIRKKLEEKDYDESEKKMQDLIGIRVVLYFSDDIQILTLLLKDLFPFVGDSIDMPSKSEFKPRRNNLVFRVPEAQLNELVHVVANKLIDSTFEVQLRTVFSEGWYEVEHDFSYKRPDDWTDNGDLLRPLHGLLATIENCDWALSGIFREMAYRSYKARNWEAMIRHHLLIRPQASPLSLSLINCFNENPMIGKEVLRLSRTKFIMKILQDKISLPLTYDNLVYLINHFFVKDPNIDSLMPLLLRAQLPPN